MKNGIADIKHPDKIFEDKTAVASFPPTETLSRNPHNMGPSILDLVKKVTEYFQASTASFRKGNCKPSGDSIQAC